MTHVSYSVDLRVKYSTPK